MKIKEIIMKNLMKIIGSLFLALPIILREVAIYVPVEYTSVFGILTIIVGAFVQNNSYETVKTENTETIINEGDDYQ